MDNGGYDTPLYPPEEDGDMEMGYPAEKQLDKIKPWWNTGLGIGIIVFGLCLTALVITTSIWAFGKNPSAIDDLQSVVKHIPLMNIGQVPPRHHRFPRFDPYPGDQYKVAIMNDDDDRSEISSDSLTDVTDDDSSDEDPEDDDEDSGFRDMVAYGHVEVLPRFAKDGTPIDGQFDVSVLARFHGGGGIVNYGPTTSNCTNTDILRTVHADSESVSEGDPVGFWGSRVGRGFRDFQQVSMVDNVYALSVRPFELDADTLVNMYINTDRYPTISLTQLGSDTTTTSTAVPNPTAPYADDDDFCRMSGAAHSDSPAHFLWAWTETADSGALYQFCRITSESPLVLSCTAETAFSAPDIVVIHDVTHIAGTNDFVITYTSDADGLAAFAVTTNPAEVVIATATAGATVIIDAAAINPACGQASPYARGAAYTVIYTDVGASIPVSAATFTVAAGVMTPVVAAAPIDTLEGVFLNAAKFGGDHITVASGDGNGVVASRIQLYHQTGSALPILLETQLINVRTEPVFSSTGFFSMTAVNNETVIVCHQPRELDSAYACQPWTVSGSGLAATLIPGDDSMFARYSAAPVICAAYVSEDDIFSCLMTDYSTVSNGFEISTVTGTLEGNGHSDYGSYINWVRGSPNRLMGLALHDAAPGEDVAVRISGCFDFENTDVRFHDNEPRNICLHGTGDVLPRIHVPGASLNSYTPRCPCTSISSKIMVCDNMLTQDIRQQIDL